MSQVISVTVRNKVATTDFEEIISFNSIYCLQFSFDEEWEEFSQRVAVVFWAGGCAEALFTGSECEMPAVLSPDCDCVFLGVYSMHSNRRIASSFVRIACQPGAHGVPHEKKSASLHEQILNFLNKQDWSIFAEKVAAGTYSAVKVNKYGLVTQGCRSVEVGVEGQEQPSDELVLGGLFFRLENGIYTLCYRTEAGCIQLPLPGGQLGAALTVGSKVYDGSEAVTVTGSDLGLAEIAFTGDYEDLLNKPEEAAVTSVNGLTGDVTIGKNDLGLATVAITGDYEDLLNKPEEAAVTSVNGLTGDVTIGKNDLGLATVAITGDYEDLTNQPVPVPSAGDAGKAIVVNQQGTYSLSAVGGGSAVTSVNGLTGDVTIGKNDLGLATVAITGSYDDLIGKPQNIVTSFNGQSGAVYLTAATLGLGLVENKRQMPLDDSAYSGINADELLDTGFYYVHGDDWNVCSNVPFSESNPDEGNCDWLFLVSNHMDMGYNCTQIAFSARSDCAIRIRNYSSGAWGEWKTVL